MHIYLRAGLIRRVSGWEKLSAFSRRSRLTRLISSFKREFFHALCFTALINLLMLTPTLYLLQIFDRVLMSYSEFTLYAVTLLLLFFLGIMGFSEWVRTRLLVRLGAKLDKTLNPHVFSAAFDHAGQDKEAGILFAHLTRLRQFLTGPGLFAFLDAPWTPFYMMVLFFLHPWLGLLAIIFCLILCFLAWIANKVTKEPIETAEAANRQELSYLDSKMRHAAVVESMGMLSDMRRSWLCWHRSTLAEGRRGIDAQARTQSLTRFTRMLQQSLSLGMGAVLVIMGEISPGAMIAANALVSRATHPVEALVNAWKDILAAKRAFLALESALEKLPDDKESALVSSSQPGATVCLEEVSAFGGTRRIPILQGVSLEIPPGMALGITGASGSGKSTLVKVMLGIWADTTGEILFNGQRIQEMKRAELGAMLGYLPQEIALFEGTIAENIARFSEVDSDKVIAACQLADAHKMILRFPKGYDTEIGEGGRFLSGGQRQRIGLARALYGNPQLVVLDEPNANLDEAGERALFQAVLALKTRGTTLVLISHRPHIMTAMDRILTLAGGQIARLTSPVPNRKPIQLPSHKPI